VCSSDLFEIPDLYPRTLRALKVDGQARIILQIKQLPKILSLPRRLLPGVMRRAYRTDRGRAWFEAPDYLHSKKRAKDQARKQAAKLARPEAGP
jgi:hypothetical protein